MSKRPNYFTYSFILTWSLRFINEHPHRWRFQIIILTTANTSYASNQGSTAKGNREWEGYIEYAHAGISGSKLLKANVTAKTLIELRGIKMAATNGLIQPSIANITAMKLYDNEMAKLR